MNLILRALPKEELISGLRNVVMYFNEWSNDHKFGLILFGSRVNGIPRIDSDIDLFYLHLQGQGNFVQVYRELGNSIDGCLLRWGVIPLYINRYVVGKEFLERASNDKCYRAELLRTRLGLLDKYSLYLGPDEEENNCLLRRALDLEFREPYAPDFIWIRDGRG